MWKTFNFFLFLSVSVAVISSSQQYDIIDIPFETRQTFAEFSKDSNVFAPETLKQLFQYLESLEDVAASTNSIKSDVFRDAIVNDYVDKLLENLNNFITAQGLDTINLPDVLLNFTAKPILITYKAHLNLTNGILAGVASVVRKSDVVISYENGLVNLIVPVGINSISIKYDYKAKLMGIGPHGTVSTKVSKTAFTVGFGFDLVGKRVSLDEFKINNLGNINVKFSGNILTDWMMNLFTTIVMPVFKSVMKNLLEKNIRGALENVVEVINSVLQSIFGYY